jgi:quinol monooxygenase YgiN
VTTVLVTQLRVHAHLVDRALGVFRAMQADVRAGEPATLAYAFYQQDDDPTRFWVHEVFADEAAKQFHLGNHRQRRADFDELLAEPASFAAVHEI